MAQVAIKRRKRYKLSKKRSQFAQDNIRLAYAYFKKYILCGNYNPETRQILFDAIMLAYLKAARNYDPSRGTRFSTIVFKYCNLAVLQALHFTQKTGFNMTLKRLDSTIYKIPAQETKDFNLILLTEVLNNSGLTSKEMNILYRHTAGGETLQSIGNDYQLCKERIRQIYNDARFKVYGYCVRHKICLNSFFEPEQLRA